MIFIRPLVFLLMVLFTITASAFDFPYLSGQIVDEAHVLSGSQYRQIKQNLSSLTQQVVVASVRTMEGLEIEEYANRLFNHWGLGDQEKNDGILIIIAPNQRQLRIEVGYGLEHIVTDAIASQIVNEYMLPHARQGNYGQALVDASLKVRDVLNGNPLPMTKQSQPKNKRVNFEINGTNIEDIEFPKTTPLRIVFGLVIVFGILGYSAKKIKVATTPEEVIPVTPEDIQKSHRERAKLGLTVFLFSLFYGLFFIAGLFLITQQFLFGVFWLVFTTLHSMLMIYGRAIAGWYKNKYFPITSMEKMLGKKVSSGRFGRGSSGGFRSSGGGFRGGGGRSGGGGSSGSW